jgi:hypothetical protein
MIKFIMILRIKKGKKNYNTYFWRKNELEIF